MKAAVFLFLILLIAFGDIANAFVCPREGVFANPDASDCGSYIWCYSYLQYYTRSCPENTYFWPLNNGCYSYYNCTTNSTPDSDNTSPCNVSPLQSVPDKYSTDCSSYIECSTDQANVWNGIRRECPIGTTYKPRSGCVTNWSNYQCQNYKDFVCQEKGAFADPHTSDCGSYIFCDPAYNLRKTFTSCPGNTYYWPLNKGCYSYYNCTTDSTPDNNNTNPCNGSGYEIIRDKYSTNCLSYMECWNPYIYVWSGIRKECPIGTTYKPRFGCVTNWSNYQCQNYQEFVCQQEGAFADPNEIDCKSYIYCDSSLQKSFASCPENTYYWPLLKGCYSYYNCTTDSTPDNDNTNPCNGFVYQNIRDKYSTDCSSYIYCASQYVNLWSGIRKECPIGTTYKPRFGCVTNWSNYQCQNYKEFVCQEVGVFADPNEIDCKSYIYCDSSLQKSFPSCPENSYFWPLHKGCYSYYNCTADSTPDNDNTNPCNGFRYQSIRDKYSTDCSSYIDCWFDYTSLWTGIRKKCPIGTTYKPRFGCVTYYSNYQCQNYKEFVCQEEGVFVDPNEIGCKSYIYCDSNLQKSYPSCPENTYFWPLNKGCYSYYNCTTDSTPDKDKTNPCNGFQYESIRDKYSTDCSSYIDCWFDYTNIWLGSRKQCPSGTTFKPRSGCISNFQCTNYQCKAEGYLVNPNATDCSSFVICDKHSSGSGSYFYGYMESCPQNTKFSPSLKKCDQFYKCDGNDPYNGIDPCLNYNWISPFVANPLVNDCSKYLGCQKQGSFNTIDVNYELACPRNTFFSPVVGKCYNNYKCNKRCSKDPCVNGVGKFVDYYSNSCQGFIECRDDSSNQQTYEPTYEKRYCPLGTLFSPKTRKCDLKYTCPIFPKNYCYLPITTTAPPKPATTPMTNTSPAPTAGK